jgi:hypothetical protein
MYVYCNTEVPICNKCCNGKTVSITYSECVFAALGIQHAMCMHKYFICGMSSPTVLFHIILKNCMIFGKCY